MIEIFIFNILFGQSLSDIHCGLKVFHRNVYNKINISVNDFFNELENYDDDFLKLYNDALNNGQVLRYLAEWDGEKASVGLKAVNKESQFYYQAGRENFISFKT